MVKVQCKLHLDIMVISFLLLETFLMDMATLNKSFWQMGRGGYLFVKQHNFRVNCPNLCMFYVLHVFWNSKSYLF